MALVVFALIPYLALTSAIVPLQPLLSKSLPLSTQALALTSGLANAAYALGTVIAVQSPFTSAAAGCCCFTRPCS